MMSRYENTGALYKDRPSVDLPHKGGWQTVELPVIWDSIKPKPVCRHTNDFA